MKTTLLIIFIILLTAFIFDAAEAAICPNNGYCYALTPNDNGTRNSELAAIFSPRDPPEKIFAILFNFLLGFVGIGAMVMIVIEGIKYMTSAGDQSRIGEAKKGIWNAVWGLILALISYLLLQTINPDLLKPGLKSINLQKQEGLDTPKDESGRSLGTPGSSVPIGKPGESVEKKKRDACLAQPGCIIRTTGANTIDCDCSGEFRGQGGF